MWLLVDEIIKTQNYVLVGEDFVHIVKSLRMKPSEALQICDGAKTVHNAVITGVFKDNAEVKISSSTPANTEPARQITLFYCLPKGDKLETVIQKTVELGVKKIVPVISSRCISRPKAADFEKKRPRLQKIAKAAAMQSHRAFVPEVAPLVKFEQAAEQLSEFDNKILFYEGGGQPVSELLSPPQQTTCIIIGSEGGFSEDEVQLLQSKGAVCASLGKRILRTETAPVAALSLLTCFEG
ncbi:MAG: 16S rRNA (uracil(1498)-N(3))-methyltransferase [Oscillospiraceae bacterium]|nr:16S rRNA (uracil(1498)-N(3))-methyltransferase [Oscillospiraceae bacterium]